MRGMHDECVQPATSPKEPEMTTTPRVPSSEFVEVGTLLEDPNGDQYVVIRKEEGVGYSTAELEDVRDYMETGEAYEGRFAPHGWRDDCYPQTIVGTAPAEVVKAVKDHEGHAAAVAQVVADIPADQHRQLYNTLDAVNHYAAKIAEAQSTVEKYASLRRENLRGLVSIVGTQDKAAKLLGMNQSNLSRALRGGA
jgi:hypothetical protein